MKTKVVASEMLDNTRELRQGKRGLILGATDGSEGTLAHIYSQPRQHTKDVEDRIDRVQILPSGENMNITTLQIRC
jgi:adenylosuccinate lyase